MFWYWLTQSLALCLVIAVVATAFSLRKEKLFDFFEWLDGKKKFIGIGWGVTALIVTLMLTKPLYNTMLCQFDGLTYNTETSYSWYKNGDYLDKCLFRSKNGAWLPLKVHRDQPQGESQEN